MKSTDIENTDIENTESDAVLIERGIMDAISQIARPRRVRSIQKETSEQVRHDTVITLMSNGEVLVPGQQKGAITGVTEQNLGAINVALRAVTERVGASLIQSGIQKVVDRVNALSRSLTKDEIQALAVANLADAQLAGLTGDDLNTLVDAEPSGLSELTADQIGVLSAEAIAKLPPAEIAAFTDGQLEGLTSDQLDELSDNLPGGLSELSPAQIKRLRKSA